jgi:hypothetical protein
MAAAAGEEPFDILCLEGSVINGPGGTGRFHIAAGTGKPMRDLIAALAARAPPLSRWEAARRLAASRRAAAILWKRWACL